MKGKDQNPKDASFLNPDNDPNKKVFEVKTIFTVKVAERPDRYPVFVIEIPGQKSRPVLPSEPLYAAVVGLIEATFSQGGS